MQLDHDEGPAIAGLLTILEDRGYSHAMREHALEAYGTYAAFEQIAALADELEEAFGNDPIRECDDCGKVEAASGFLDWVNGRCEDCDPGLVNDPENQRRIQEREA